MKRTFLNRRNALLSPAFALRGGAILGAVLLVVLLRLAMPAAFLRIEAPLLGIGTSLTDAMHGLVAGVESNAALVAKNDRLTSENAALALENRALVEKDADLEKLQGGQAHSLPGVMAGIVARPPESPYDTLIIAAGSDDGIVSGAKVFGEGGVPLGAVSSVTALYARVTLFSAPGVETDGWVGASRLPLSLIGMGGGAFSTTIPRAANVTVGDTIFISGPGALPIATVLRIDGDPASPTLSLRIAPKANLFSLTWVRVAPLP